MARSCVGEGTTVGVGGTGVSVGASVGVGGTVFVGNGVKVGRAVLGGATVVAAFTSMVGVGVLQATKTKNATIRVTLPHKRSHILFSCLVIVLLGLMSGDIAVQSQQIIAYLGRCVKVRPIRA